MGRRGPNLLPVVVLLGAVPVRSANNRMMRKVTRSMEGGPVMIFTMTDYGRIFYLIMWPCRTPMMSHSIELPGDVAEVL